MLGSAELDFLGFQGADVRGGIVVVVVGAGG